jgi:dipeptidyl aminopeptidase/acylaminoacyl peptidase
MSDLSTFYRNTEPWIAAASYPEYGHPVADRELLEALSPLQRVESLTAPLLVVHGATATNVPVSESEQMVEALRALQRPVHYLLFCDDGHEITRRGNHAVLASTVAGWVRAAFRSDV